MRFSTFCLWLVATCGSSLVASAQAPPEPNVALTVRVDVGVPVSCLSHDALQERVAYYSGAQLRAADVLRLELHVDGADSAELRVYRDAELISLRRFANLPAACADRRDAIALSSALALEGALRELARRESPHEVSAADVSVSGVSDAAPTVSSSRAAEMQTPAQDAGTTPTPRQTPLQRPDPAPQRFQVDSEPEPAGAPATEHAAADGGWRVDLHGGGRWLTGALPTAVWAGALGAELWLTQRTLLDAAAYASSLSNSAVSGARARAWLAGGELFACTPWTLGEVAAESCLGALVAACRASGRDYPLPRPAATLPWAAGAARIAVRWPAQDFLSLRLVLQTHVNMVRPQLEAAGSGTRLRPGWFGGLLGLDMIVTWE